MDCHDEAVPVRVTFPPELSTRMERVSAVARRCSADAIFSFTSARRGWGLGARALDRRRNVSVAALVVVEELHDETRSCAAVRAPLTLLAAFVPPSNGASCRCGSSQPSTSIDAELALARRLVGRDVEAPHAGEDPQ